MHRTKFNKYLNAEPKLYNFSYTSLIVGVAAGVTGALTYGLLGFFAAFGGGFWLGKIIGEAWWSGNIQRYIYWNLPAIFTLSIIGKAKSLPPSHLRRLL